ncbi:inositol monophosphatase family protein [Patescibacteria group bacterium]
MGNPIKNMVKAAKAGGIVLNKYFGRNLQRIQKTSNHDYYTKADIESEGAIINILTKSFPTYSIYSEEAGSLRKKSEYTLVVDPLDGTFNFIIGIPNYSIPIALLRYDKVIASVIYQPHLDLVYHAEKGNGAYMGKTPLKVNKHYSYAQSTIAYLAGSISSRNYNCTTLKKLEMNGAMRILTNWSPANDFCLLASGKIEAVVNYVMEKHDYLAGKLLAQEAGAIITDFKGNIFKQDIKESFIAANGKRIINKVIESL